MKNLVLFGVLVLLPQLSLGSNAEAEKAFEKSATVQKAIASLKNQKFVQEEAMESVELGGSCGFVGCDASALVVQRFSTKGANTQTRAVLGQVSLPSIGEPTVRLVELKEVK